MLAVSVLAVLLPGGWWWATRPERTARQFAALLEEGRIEAAERMMPSVRQLMATPGVTAAQFAQSGLAFEPRRLVDAVLGRLRFRVGDVPYQFVARRSEVEGTPDGWSALWTRPNTAWSAAAPGRSGQSLNSDWTAGSQRVPAQDSSPGWSAGTDGTARHR
jgi:hypothetical protein